MPFIDVEDATLYYEVHGEGPPLVLAHGAGGNAIIWWRQVAHFARTHTVLVFDHRGFGRSRCEPGAFHPRHGAADLLAVLDAAGIDRAALVCQSMGGWSGLRAAVDSPSRVACLALSGSPGGLLTDGVQACIAAATARIVRSRQADEDSRLVMALGPDFPARDPAAALLYLQIGDLNPPMNAANLAHLVEPHVRPEELQVYAIPTLFLVGEHDAFFTPAAIRETADLVPGAAVYEFAGVGHSTYWEAPDRFNQVVGEFVATFGPAAPPPRSPRAGGAR